MLWFNSPKSTRLLLEVEKYSLGELDSAKPLHDRPVESGCNPSLTPDSRTSPDRLFHAGESLMWTVVQNGPNFDAGTGEKPWVELENLA